MPKILDTSIEHSRFFWQGLSGCGKTHLIGHLHNRLVEVGSRGVYMFDFEKGHGTLTTAAREAIRLGGYPNLFNLEYDLYHDPDPKHPTGFKLFLEKITELENDDQGFGAIAIDSLTSFQRALMNYVLSINNVKGRRHGMTVENDFGVLISFFEQLLPQFLNLNLKFEFVLTAHIKEHKNENTGELWWRPAITGKALPQSIGGWFSEVWMLSADGYPPDIQRIAQTVSGNRAQCKTQTAGMPAFTLVEDAVDRVLHANGILKNYEPPTDVISPSGSWIPEENQEKKEGEKEGGVAEGVNQSN